MSAQLAIDFIVLAAGKSSRFQESASIDEYQRRRKPFVEIFGKSIIEHSLESFYSWSNCGVIILVHPSSLIDEEEQHLEQLKRRFGDKIVLTAGGDERVDSVQKGFNTLKHLHPESAFVGIHDSARPFIPHAVLDNIYRCLRQEPDKGVIPALAVADTLKRHQNGRIDTLDRSHLYRAQTPQCFSTQQLDKAIQFFRQSGQQHLTDDSQFFELSGYDVQFVTGDNQLEKITHFADYQKMQREYQMMQEDQLETVHGTGYDVHRFDLDKTGPIMICGIAVEHEVGLDAHSDGDVGIHALCDALFGAMSDGDIGSHFPPSDPQWKDKQSNHFLSYATQRLTALGGAIIQCDITLICEYPKIGPHREQMRQRIADICGIDIRRVSVKATTSEKLGFTGRSEGLAAMASCTIQRPSPTNR